MSFSAASSIYSAYKFIIMGYLIQSFNTVFFLLLLMRAFIPKDVETIIVGSDFTLNIYWYFPLNNVSIYSTFLKRFEYQQASSSFQLLKIQYISTFANTSSILAWTFLMFIYFIFVYLTRLVLNRFRECYWCSCAAKTLYWIFNKLWRIMMFGYFIRNALQLSQFILISSINEIYEWNTTDFYKLISFIFSILMVILYLVIIGWIGYLIFSSYRVIEDNHNKLEEFFRGLRQNKIHRIYAIMLLSRRLVFIILLITLTSIYSRTLIAILLVIQVAYVACLSYLRPYEKIKWNFIEILNEIYFWIFILFLEIINSEDEWNSIKTNIFIWVLTSNIFIVFTIVLGKFYLLNNRLLYTRYCKLDQIQMK